MKTRVARILPGFGVLASVILACPILAQVVDHRAIAQVESLPQETIDQIARSRWYFIHASVGDNIMQGLRDLNRAEPLRYPLAVCTLTSNFVPPVPTVAGSAYEHHFSSDKMPQFQSMVNSNGWQVPAVDIALMKFCYLDGLATSLTPGPQLAAQYVAMMASLEQRHPDTVFVYVSMPLLIYTHSVLPPPQTVKRAPVPGIPQFCFPPFCLFNLPLTPCGPGGIYHYVLSHRAGRRAPGLVSPGLLCGRIDCTGLPACGRRHKRRNRLRPGRS
jgi:hypothetical protein